MENGLLLGNGINRCVIHDIAWEVLQEELANDYRVKHSDSLSLPLDFECMANQLLRKYPEKGIAVSGWEIS